MERVTRAVMLIALLAATAASAQTSTVKQRIHFTGADTVFSVPTATAKIAVEPPFYP